MQEVLKHTDSITEALRICLAKKIHFAAYKLPDKAGIDLVIQKNPEMLPLENLNERLPRKGFLVAPFSRKDDKTYLIRPEMVLHNSFSSGQLEELLALPENQSDHNTQPYPEDTGKEDYVKLIRNTIGRINSGEFEKVVLSRVKTVKGDFSGRLPDIFYQLCNIYPNAFVYLFCIKGQCWTGATPEPFICSKGDELVTVSLAGTRNHRKEDLDISNWNRKELQEQDYVTLHIEEILKNYQVSGYAKNGPYVTKAGNLLHLRTDFTFSAQAVSRKLPKLIHALHPTPAICGMSTGKAMDFIGNFEKHSREYYTGFLGPVDLGNFIQLFVNLRCLKVYDDRVVLYVGGGITHDSVAEEEWEETEIKADTLLSVLRQIR